MTVLPLDPRRVDRLSSLLNPPDAWTGLDDHRQAFATTPPIDRTPDGAFVDLVERSGLHGRGGAGFPTAVKLRAVAEGRRRPVVLVNGSEGEPASAKDAVLMSLAPHIVIDGALLAASAVGADGVVIGVKVGAGRSRQAIGRAVEERFALEPWTPRLRVIDVPPTYVAGEERALVNLANGGRAIPPSGTSRPFERGVGNRPTLVQNVETLAHLALIRAMGADWFRALGHPDAPGTMLVSVSGPVADPGVFEVPTGERLVEVIRGAGGATEEIRAILVGGYAGTWLTEDAIERATLDRAGMAGVGGTVGCGAIVALSASACGVRATAEIMRWLATNTAGQCGPCVSGLGSIATTLVDLWRGTARRDSLDRLIRWSHDIEGRGACRYPDGAVRFLRSALTAFGDDARTHAAGRPCVGAHLPTLVPIPNIGQAA
ncbi:MAG: NADH-ubiquinone oxidoreductase-F iron-sulfur binding region domain-containing protein [Actinomycetota bacterium]